MAKLINAPDPAQWDEQLVKDLAFIKKNRRYPFSRMTLMPLLTTLLLLTYLVWPFWRYISGEKKSDLAVVLVVVVLMSVPVLISFVRYLRLISFKVVPTPYSLSENMKQLQKFLEEQHLLVFRHPKAPEVFQIISTNISAMGEDREVLIFLADDNRILVNSHFSSSRKKFRLLIGQTHEKGMIRMLNSWLKSQTMTTNTVSRQRMN
jgi:hypothetical protein